MSSTNTQAQAMPSGKQILEVADEVHQSGWNMDGVPDGMLIDFAEMILSRYGAGQPAASQEPLFWYRPRSDGGHESPLHNGQIGDVRKASGAWVPLFAGAAPVSAEPVATLQGVDEYGPRLNWHKHWVNFHPGTQFYAAPVAAQAYDIDRAVEAFQIAEHKCHERLAAAGVVDAPEIGVKEGLLAVIQYLAAQAQPPKLTPGELEALHDFQRTTIDDSFHTLDKPMIKRLTSAGALESMGFGKHRLTQYGAWLLEPNASAQQPVSSADGLAVSVEPWSGWACQYPGKLPRLYGAKDIAVANHYPEEGDRLIFLTAQQDAELLQFVIDEECLVTNTVVCGDDHWRVSWPHLTEVQAEFHPTARAAIRAAIDAARKEQT